MAGVLLHQGEQVLLEAFVNKTAPQDLILRLFSNNVTPAETDTEASYTEVTGYGYAAIPMVGSGGWTFTSGDPSSIAFGECSFAFTGAAGNVYGYDVTQASSGKAVIAERFSDGPYNIAASGDKINVTPTFTVD